MCPTSTKSFSPPRRPFCAHPVKHFFILPASPFVLTLPSLSCSPYHAFCFYSAGSSHFSPSDWFFSLHPASPSSSRFVFSFPIISFSLSHSLFLSLSFIIPLRALMPRNKDTRKQFSKSIEWQRNRQLRLKERVCVCVFEGERKKLGSHLNVGVCYLYRNLMNCSLKLSPKKFSS